MPSYIDTHSKNPKITSSFVEWKSREYSDLFRKAVCTRFEARLQSSANVTFLNSHTQALLKAQTKHFRFRSRTWATSKGSSPELVSAPVWVLRVV